MKTRFGITGDFVVIKSSRNQRIDNALLHQGLGILVGKTFGRIFRKDGVGFNGQLVKRKVGALCLKCAIEIVF